MPLIQQRAEIIQQRAESRDAARRREQTESRDLKVGADGIEPPTAGV